MEKRLMDNMPTLRDIIHTRPTVYRYLKTTPFFHYPTLGKLVGTDIWSKHEIHQPVGAASLTAAVPLRDRLVHKQVVSVINGGNIAPERLKYIIQEIGSC